MIIVLIALALAIAAVVFFKIDDGEYEGWAGAGFVSLIVTVVLAVILPISVVSSFDTAVNLDATYNGVVSEYGHAIDKYTESAVLIKINEQTFTDFRYAGYQENVAGLIKDLRYQTANYNRLLLKKRAYKRSPVFSWLIVLPQDSLRLISLVDY